jgi:hypothetical protein
VVLCPIKKRRRQMERVDFWVSLALGIGFIALTLLAVAG